MGFTVTTFPFCGSRASLDILRARKNEGQRVRGEKGGKVDATKAFTIYETSRFRGNLLEEPLSTDNRTGLMASVFLPF